MPRELLLLHGFTNTGAAWAQVTSSLGERPGESYRATAPDIRGHGEAGERTPVTLGAVLDDIRAAAPQGAFTLAGYSMGGRIALHAALAPDLGERIERLVLIGASPGIADPAQRAVRKAADEQLASELEQLTIDELAHRWAQTPVLAGLPEQVAARAHADRLRNTPAGLARALRGLGTGALPSLWERLHELGMPVTLLVGERDQKFQAIADEMAAAIARADVVLVAGAGHAVHLEQPAAVVEQLSRTS